MSVALTKLDDAFIILASHGITERNLRQVREDMGFVELDMTDGEVFTLNRLMISLIEDINPSQLVDLLLEEFNAAKVELTRE